MKTRAEYSPHGVIYSPKVLVSPTGIVSSSFFNNNTRANINSFQFCRNKNITHVAIAGFDIGRAIFKKIPNSVAPSILAASIIESLIPKKNPLIINIEIGIPKAIYGRINEK